MTVMELLAVAGRMEPQVAETPTPFEQQELAFHD
jgi:hypothetical protein